MFVFIFLKTSYASETRVLSMGGIGYYTHDNTNIFIFPGSINLYRNQVIAELRAEKEDQFYSIGIHLPVGTDRVLGVYLNRPLIIVLPTDIGDYISNVKLDHSTSIFFGNKIPGGGWGIGLTFGMDSYTTEVGSNKEEESAHYYGLSAGISTDIYDLGLRLKLPSFKWEYETASYSYNGFGINLNARYFTNKKGEIQIVPLGVIEYLGMKEEFDSGVSGVPKDVVDYSTIQLAFGIGINYELNEKNLLVMGVEDLAYQPVKYL